MMTLEEMAQLKALYGKFVAQEKQSISRSLAARADRPHESYAALCYAIVDIIDRVGELINNREYSLKHGKEARTPCCQAKYISAISPTGWMCEKCGKTLKHPEHGSQWSQPSKEVQS